MSAETDENAASIPRAAKELGLDSFTLYGLIQRDKVRSQRARRGELIILQIEIDRVLDETAVSTEDEKEAR
jgi:hypothetical protein